MASDETVPGKPAARRAADNTDTDETLPVTDLDGDDASVAAMFRAGAFGERYGTGEMIG